MLLGVKRDVPRSCLLGRPPPAEYAASRLIGQSPTWRAAMDDLRAAAASPRTPVLGGTLFLDEVGELPLELQPKLLRILEGHPFRRVGGERSITADVRLVSATNCHMEQAVASGRFRLDLYHRLRVVEVTLPPLRSRGADAELLAIHFLQRIGAELGRPDLDISPEALLAIRAHGWPGNVRELRNALERAIVLSRTGTLTPHDLPPEVLSPRHAGSFLDSPHPSPPPVSAVRKTPLLSGRELGDVVRQHVIEAYRESDGNLARAARSLGIGRATLRRRLRDYGVTLEGLARPRRA